MCYDGALGHLAFRYRRLITSGVHLILKNII